jgi:hypothetical protein
LFLFFLDFVIRSFLHLVLQSPITQAEEYTLKTRRAQNMRLTCAINAYKRRCNKPPEEMTSQ